MKNRLLPTALVLVSALGTIAGMSQEREAAQNLSQLAQSLKELSAIVPQKPVREPSGGHDIFAKRLKARRGAVSEEQEEDEGKQKPVIEIKYIVGKIQTQQTLTEFLQGVLDTVTAKKDLIEKDINKGTVSNDSYIKRVTRKLIQSEMNPQWIYDEINEQSITDLVTIAEKYNTFVADQTIKSNNAARITQLKTWFTKTPQTLTPERNAERKKAYVQEQAQLKEAAARAEQEQKEREKQEAEKKKADQEAQERFFAQARAAAASKKKQEEESDSDWD